MTTDDHTLVFQAQLRAFIPEMLKYSTGRGKPGWGKESCKPIWWPEDIPWANVRSDVRTEEQKQRVRVPLAWVSYCFSILNQPPHFCYSTSYAIKSKNICVIVKPIPQKRYDILWFIAFPIHHSITVKLGMALWIYTSLYIVAFWSSFNFIRCLEKLTKLEVKGINHFEDLKCPYFWLASITVENINIERCEVSEVCW